MAGNTTVVASAAAGALKSGEKESLLNNQRYSIVQMYEFAVQGNKGKMPRGFRAKVALYFKFSPRTVDRVIARWKTNAETNRNHLKAGRKTKYADLIAKFKLLPLNH